MKNIFFIFTVIAIFGFSSCDNPNKSISTDLVNNTKSASESNKSSDLPSFSFEELEHNFGKIIQGEKVTYAFKFTNTGGSPLIISKVSTSCGCTVSKYPKTPVKSGKSDYIEVTFDSKKKKGFQNKSITIMANTQPNKTTLRVKTQVVLPQNN
jgi:hypothetical protein